MLTVNYDVIMNLYDVIVIIGVKWGNIESVINGFHISYIPAVDYDIILQ